MSPTLLSLSINFWPVNTFKFKPTVAHINFPSRGTKYDMQTLREDNN